MTTVPTPHAERKTFAAMLDEISQIAHAKLPTAQHSRLEMGHALVTQGAVFPEDDGEHYTVCSHEGEEAHSWWVNGACPCPDARYKAPHGRCKHWMAALLYKRTLEELTKPCGPPPEGPEGAAATEVDADAIQRIPKKYVHWMHGKPHVLYVGLLDMAKEQGLIKLKADLVSVSNGMALATATAWFSDGREFTEAADATPENVGNPKIALHYPRMALTRAKARCLRDALNIGIVAKEEVAA